MPDFIYFIISMVLFVNTEKGQNSMDLTYYY